MDQQQPGQVVGPQLSPSTDGGDTQQPAEIAPADNKPPEPSAPWGFTPQETPPAPTPPIADKPEAVSWTASEFIAHQKSPKWYLVLAASALVLAGIIYLLTRDKISTAVVLIAAIAFGGYAGRKPRTLQYELGPTGLHVGSKAYDYDHFKSFSVVDEGAVHSVIFMPLRRFMPTLTIYFAPEDEAKILQLLSDRLPVEEGQGDIVDRFMRRIRF